ncbi:MAG: hypothetical protein AB1782_11045 [Cyanobacteriota bacterium]
MLKKTTASLLTLLLVFSYLIPLQAQDITSEYEVVPPVSQTNPNVTQMPDVQDQAGINTPFNSTYHTNAPLPQNQLQPLKGSVATAPRGTNFEVTIQNTINSMSSRVGDTFTAQIDEPLIIDGQTVIPPGSELVGQITYVESAGRIGKNALMDIRFTSVKLPNGERLPVNAKILTTDSSGVLKGGKNSNIVLKATGTAAGTTAAGAVAGTSAGAILGSVAGGAIFGTAVGGLVGVGYALYRKGKNIVLPSGTKLGVTLEQPLTISTTKTGSY